MTIKNGIITEFKDDERWLSNFVPAKVTLDGATYPSVENAYQAAKTTNPAERAWFLTCSSSEAKGLGKKVKLRPDWEHVKDSIMENLLRQKFHSGIYRDKLIDSGNIEIQEGNYWSDKYWGICLRTGKGENKLGKLIMKIRSDLTAEPKETVIDIADIKQFDIPTEFIERITPWEDLVPQLANMITVVSQFKGKPNIRTDKLCVHLASTSVSNIRIKAKDRMEYREKLRAEYSVPNSLVQKLLNGIADNLIDDGYKQIELIFESKDIAKEFVPWEVRRALIGIIRHKIKDYL